MTSVQGCDARVAHGIDERRHTGHRQEQPTKILALRGGAVFWPSVISESFGIRPHIVLIWVYASSSKFSGGQGTRLRCGRLLSAPVV